MVSGRLDIVALSRIADTQPHMTGSSQNVRLSPRLLSREDIRLTTSDQRACTAAPRIVTRPSARTPSSRSEPSLVLCSAVAQPMHPSAGRTSRLSSWTRTRTGASRRTRSSSVRLTSASTLAHRSARPKASTSARSASWTTGRGTSSHLVNGMRSRSSRCVRPPSVFASES